MILPCNGLIFSSGYEGRLLNLEFIGQLEQLCIQKKVTPIAIMQPSIPKMTSLHIVDNVITIGNDNMTLHDMIMFHALYIKLLHADLLSRECILFQVETSKNVTDIIFTLKDIGYCKMHDIPQIKFHQDEKGTIDLVYITIETE